jgi:hypothetical protein
MRNVKAVYIAYLVTIVLGIAYVITLGLTGR